MKYHLRMAVKYSMLYIPVPRLYRNPDLLTYPPY
nr:MAG TPA: hypothetical protein [Bacteriophage sp.]